MLIQTAKKLKIILTFKLRGCLGVLDTSVYSDVRRSTLHMARIFQGCGLKTKVYMFTFHGFSNAPPLRAACNLANARS